MVVTAEVWNRVVQVQGENCYELGAGSGTLIEMDGRQMLLTADHLTTGEPEEHIYLRSPFITGERLVGQVLTRISPRIDSIDVALFDCSIGREVLRNTSLAVGSNGMSYSQDIYVLGHPYGLHLQLGKENPELQLPLAKRGILAGAKWEAGCHLMFTDVIANPGFSGGPAVLRLGQGTGPWTLAGVVKGQYMQKAPANAVGAESDVPAGVTAVTDIGEALKTFGLVDEAQ